MLSPARHSGRPGPKLLVLYVLALAAVEGCGPPNAKDKFDQAFKNNPEFKQVQVAPFSGRVTIDGQPPAEDMSVFVILNDPQKLKKPGEITRAVMAAMVTSETRRAARACGSANKMNPPTRPKL